MSIIYFYFSNGLFYFVPVPDLWVESHKTAEAMEQFAASEGRKSTAHPAALSKLIQLPAPAKTSIFFFLCCLSDLNQLTEESDEPRSLI